MFAKSKEDATEKSALYKIIIKRLKNQLNRKIKMLRSDRGSEYEEPYGEFCTQYGIIYKVTPPFSPQSNDVAEQKKIVL